MITKINKASPKERLGKYYRYSNMNEGLHSPEVEVKREKEYADADYYPYLEGLPSSEWNLELHKDFEMTRRIKYSRSVSTEGAINKTVDVFVEIEWHLDIVVEKGEWFKDSIMGKEKHTAWIPAEAFTFDFSDETIETIVDCNET